MTKKQTGLSEYMGLEAEVKVAQNSIAEEGHFAQALSEARGGINEPTLKGWASAAWAACLILPTEMQR